ncbi:hypothetical protein AMJ47_02750 [Parcubacteria bacterium DG_72]|nr:MAG: hypothetical protein AMJ47_02750 [Parcubacteria bacterium DG_72]
MPYSCGCCAFLWVLHRKGYWIDQEEIAQRCNLRVPKRDLKKFTRKIKVAKSKKNVGTSPERMHIYLNRLLRAKRIPLIVEKYPISKIENPKEFVVNNLRVKNDIVVSFSCKPFRQYKFSWGHVCVISGFDLKKEELTLGDPGQNQLKYWKVSLKKITKAMDKKYDGSERGFLLVKAKNKKSQ